MSVNVLAFGLEPVPSSIEAQFEKLRALGYYVESCLVGAGETAEEVARLHIESRTFDCVLFDAGLRAPAQLLLFEKLVNLVHARAPLAKMCFNADPADSAGAVQRWA